MANVTLRHKKIANQRESLYLDYFPPIINPKNGKETRREFLKLYIYQDPKNTLQKEHNKSTLEFGNIIRAKRLLQIRNREFGFKENVEIHINIVAYYEKISLEYYNNGSKSQYSSWKSSCNYFKKFAGDTLNSRNINLDLINKYREFLLNSNSLKNNNSKISINTASSYYKHFLFVLKRAYKEGILSKNLAINANYIKPEESFREYLTEEELKRLWETAIKYPEIKRAALFSALTGFRYVDVEALVWERIFGDKHQGFYIQLKEQKTGNIHNHPIPKIAYNILKQEGTSTGKVFKTLIYHRVSRYLKDWVKDAKIHKKISFHNFRHSYATLQLANGTDIYTVSKLLGHKNVSTTQIYTKVMDRNKIEAANRINLDLNGL